jgi:RNA polymerase sigma factor (sigma-70 family)
MDEAGAKQLGRLLDQHAGPLELFARQWTPEAADVVQEAFVRLMEQPEFPADPVAWLYRVVRNAALNQARARHRRAWHERQQAESRPAFVLDEPGAAEFPSREIHQALLQLPLDEREVVIARLWGKLTLQQIANLTDSSTSTVHRRFQSALHQLRQRLSELWSIE